MFLKNLFNKNPNIGKLKEENDRAKLIELLHHQSADIQTAAAFALGEILTDVSWPHVKPIFENVPLHLCTQFGLGMAAPRKTRAGGTEYIAKNFIWGLKKEGEQSQKAAAVLVGLGTDTVTVFLEWPHIESMHHVNTILEQLGHPAYTTLINLQNTKAKPGERERAGVLLTLAGSKAKAQILETIENGVADGEYLVEVYVNILKKTNRMDEIRSFIVTFLTSSTYRWQQRDRYVDIFTSLGSSAIPALLNTLDHESHSVSEFSALCLGKLKASQAITPLISKMRASPLNSIYSNTLISLGETDSVRAVLGEKVNTQSVDLGVNILETLSNANAVEIISNLLALLEQTDKVDTIKRIHDALLHLVLEHNAQKIGDDDLASLLKLEPTRVIEWVETKQYMNYELANPSGPGTRTVEKKHREEIDFSDVLRYVKKEQARRNQSHESYMADVRRRAERELKMLDLPINDEKMEMMIDKLIESDKKDK